MASIAFVALGSLGDVNPLLGTARALKQRGHDVTFVTTPYYADFVASAGVPFLPIGTTEQFTTHMANPALWHPLRFIGVSFSAALEWMPDSYRILEGLHRRGLDVIAAQLQCFGARLAAETLDIPMATIMPCPILVQSRFDPVRYPMLAPLAAGPPLLARLEYAIINAMIGGTVRGGINRFRKTLGLAPLANAMDWLWATDLHIGLWPDWMRRVQPDTYPQLKVTGFIDFDGEPSFGAAALDPAFLARKPIVFTPGSAMLFGKAFFAAAAAAMAAMPERAAYFVTRYPEQLPASLPANVRHLPFAPFAALLPHCSAVVHHGGIGTAARALRAAIPQIIVPFAYDQYDNAQILKRLGVGEKLTQRELSAPALLQKLTYLLTTPAVAAQCETYARALASDDKTAETCALIESLAPAQSELRLAGQAQVA